MLLGRARAGLWILLRAAGTTRLQDFNRDMARRSWAMRGQERTERELLTEASHEELGDSWQGETPVI